MGSRRQDHGTRSLHCRGYDTAVVGEKELRDVFSAFGKVIDVYLPKDYFTKKVRGFAYIQFESDPDADAARIKLDRSDVFGDGHTVNIMWAAGDRKTPTDMRRLDIERDNPHARRALQKTHGPDWQREWDRDRELLRRDRESRYYPRDRPPRDRHPPGPWDRPPPRDWDHRSRDRDRVRDRDWDRPRDRRPPPRSRSRSPRRRGAFGYGFGGAGAPNRPFSRSPPPRFRDSDDRRRYDDDPRPDFGRKRGRSRSPSNDRRPVDDDFDRKRSRRRTSSRSPPLSRRRSISPPPPFSHPSDRSRRRSRSPTPPRDRDRSPYDRDAGPVANGIDGGMDKREPREAMLPKEEPALKLRSSVAPKIRSTPLSPVETTPASPESR